LLPPPPTPPDMRTTHPAVAKQPERGVGLAAPSKAEPPPVRGGKSARQDRGAGYPPRTTGVAHCRACHRWRTELEFPQWLDDWNGRFSARRRRVTELKTRAFLQVEAYGTAGF
jgi:hypothetical protein